MGEVYSNYFIKKYCNYMIIIVIIVCIVVYRILFLNYVMKFQLFEFLLIYIEKIIGNLNKNIEILIVFEKCICYILCKLMFF